jgi:hypothetical protein
MSSSRQIACVAAILAVVLIPGFWYVQVPLDWDARHLSPPTGDEPHYLLIADAIAQDHDLRVKAAYDRNAGEMLVPTADWQIHTRTGPNGTFSIHSIGLSAFVAPAFACFGRQGVRVLLGAQAALIPVLFFGIARLAGVPFWQSCGLAVCTSFGLPFLAASGQLYPDLPTGVVLLALAYVVLAQTKVSASRPVLLLAGP